MSLINTRIQNLRANSNLDKYEIRPSRYGALDLFMMQSEDPNGILTPELRQVAENSIHSVLQVPVIDYDAGVSIGNVRSVTIADSENTSQLVTLTFATYAWGFTLVPAAFMNNEISMQRDFEKKFNKYLYEFANTLDTACIAALGAAKSQVFADPLGYTVTGNVLQVPLANRQQILADLNPIMAANDFFGQIHVVGNGGVESLVRTLTESGIYNAENKTYQYSDKMFHFTNRIANSAGPPVQYANLYAVNEGSVGMLTRFEREALLNRRMADGTEWSIDTLPMLNMPVGTYFYESKGDNSAIAGAATADLTRAYKEHYGFAVDVAFLTAYNSDPATIASPIVQATLLAS